MTKIVRTYYKWPYSLIINEGGRGITLTILPEHGIWFRLYVAGFVFMLSRDKNGYPILRKATGQ